MLELNRRLRYTVRHPPDLKLEDVLSFLHHPIFTEDWRDLGLDDEDLAELELCVMATAASGREDSDSSGVTIARVSPEPRPDRPPFVVLVCYVYFEHRSIAALLAVDPDTDAIGITDDDRLRLRVLIEEISAEI